MKTNQTMKTKETKETSIKTKETILYEEEKA
jgi:hypothetical protein